MLYVYCLFSVLFLVTTIIMNFCVLDVVLALLKLRVGIDTHL